MKQSHDKTVFIWWMFLCSWSLMSLFVFGSGQSLPDLSLRSLSLAAAAAVCFVLYHWFTGFAYREGDLSMTYPLAQTAMLYVPVWGVFLLGERLTFAGGLGILLIVMGAYCIQLRSLSPDELFRPFSQLTNRSVQAALLAGFVYSIGAVLDKTGVDNYSAYHFTYVLVFFMLSFMSLNLVRSRYRGRILKEWSRNRTLILWSGPVMLASFLSFRFGLQLSPVSYAVPVRQVSLLIGVLIGLLFLREPFGRIRLLSSGLILLGVVFIWHG
ncbi:EamA family transporter [uncultured Desulfuromusa sp.]|uniref:EamA family transporter n=1 Tax=uncultured Desulfuromusa sp. TaxID=219183 RepID=UPI002AA88DF1|nr:EamA family transporter [uncultured Desulfuromusa sp.]